IRRRLLRWYSAFRKNLHRALNGNSHNSLALVDPVIVIQFPILTGAKAFQILGRGTLKPRIWRHGIAMRGYRQWGRTHSGAMVHQECKVEIQQGYANPHADQHQNTSDKRSAPVDIRRLETSLLVLRFARHDLIPHAVAPFPDSALARAARAG